MRAIVLFLLYNVYNFHVLARPNIAEKRTVLQNCTEKYGDQPAQNAVGLQNLLDLVDLCLKIRGSIKIFQFNDSYGNQRLACLLITYSSQALPLLVWIPPSFFPSLTILLTHLVYESKSANLTGTIDGPLGYHILIPFARTITLMYPIPDNQALGWDNWYRNYNRSDPALNVDVQTIDYFINQSIHYESDVYHVDKSRIFMSGWSNGAAMAVEYALNTPGIAAAAVYSASDPYRDYKDPCAQVPYPTHFTPIRLVYNRCDILNFCRTGTAFIQDLNNRYPNVLIAEAIIIDIFFRITTTCNPLCNDITNIGTFQHIRWPILVNDKLFFDFFRKHKLKSI